MTYRSADTAFEQRIDEASEELRTLGDKADALSAKVTAAQVELREMETSIRERGASRLGIPTVVAALLVVAVLVFPLQLRIGTYIHNGASDTVAPIFILCGPAILGAAVAFPYRNLGKKYAAGTAFGLLLVVLVIAMVVRELVLR